MSLEVIVPGGSGELVDLKTLATDDLTERVRALMDVRSEIDRFNRIAREELADRLLYQGEKSFALDNGYAFRLKAVEKVWDLDRLHDTLDKFVEQGVIAQAKASACFRVREEVNARAVQALLDDPRTAPEVSLCFALSEAPRTVEVKRA